MAARERPQIFQELERNNCTGTATCYWQDTLKSFVRPPGCITRGGWLEELMHRQRNVRGHRTFTLDPRPGRLSPGWRLLQPNISEDCAGATGAHERIYAMRFQETILQRLGKALHVQMDDITHEPLPRRWVDLILYLEEQERERAERAQPETEPQRRPN